MPYCSHENASLSIFNSFQTKGEWSSGVLAGAGCTICNNNRRSGVLLDLVTRVGLVGQCYAVWRFGGAVTPDGFVG